MFSIIKSNKKTIMLVLTILAIPFVLIMLEIGIVFIFNLGTYLGTFMRGLYQIVV
ncbi:MAG: hypothetical protein RR359_02305 [Bacilli bacterium]